MQDMKDKVVLITGGGTGLGAATALGFARRGANVVVNYASSADAANAVAKECVALGVRAVAVQADVGEDADCRALVERTLSEFGRLDTLVNNAGTTKFADQADLDALVAEDFQAIYRVNVIGVYQMVRAARAALEASGAGAIVNISSIAGVMGIGSSMAYAASKGALNTMTLSLARSLAPKIRVNAVCPGYIGSDWFAKRLGAEKAAKVEENAARSAPLQFACKPEHIAESVLFFGGPQSSHVTGEFMIADAGLHLGAAPLRAR
ncbi:MAG: SDR family oxidoreductase [Gemmatimonadales bacterium]|nr:SDR family oxidoreductase [Gemmatimonadales bacterium]